jgi:hypothetical protein
MAARTVPVSRRDVVTGAAAMCLAAPFVLGAPADAGAATGDDAMSEHPVVGTWVGTEGDQTVAYSVFYADGNFSYYDRRTALFEEASDPHAPVFGYGRWRPTADRTAELYYEFAFGDSSIDTAWKMWNRWTIGEDDKSAHIEWRLSFKGRDGTGADVGPGTGTARRFEWEPFEP